MEADFDDARTPVVSEYCGISCCWWRGGAAGGNGFKECEASHASARGAVLRGARRSAGGASAGGVRRGTRAGTDDYGERGGGLSNHRWVWRVADGFFRMAAVEQAERGAKKRDPAETVRSGERERIEPAATAHGVKRFRHGGLQLR